MFESTYSELFTVDMELRHLRYFLAVADALSFTKGAEKLRIAQPSLSRQIKDLEEEVGVRLLFRTKKKVALTNEGEVFLGGARRLLKESVEMVESIQTLSRRTGSTINIGYVPSPVHTVLSASLTAFERQFPTVRINLFGLSPVDQFRALKDGKIETGFVGLTEPTEEGDFQFRLIASYPAVVLLPKNHRLSKKRTIRLKDLETFFFVSLSDACYPGYTRRLNEICQSAAIKPKVLETVDSESALFQAIRMNLGVAILPEPIKDASHERIAIRKLSPAAHFGSFVAWKEGNSSPLLQEYLQIVTTIGKKVSTPTRNS
jgi:LysR family transcriptional regulator, hca operon transcriptional activator